MSDAYQLYAVTGGPAYPQTPEVNESGPTWLDVCAWHAMQRLLRTGAFTPEAVADDAYRLAAAMLAEKRRLEKV